MFSKTVIEKAMSGTILTSEEKDAVRFLLERCSGDKTKIIKPAIGQICEIPTNPVTGYLYKGTALAAVLKEFMECEPDCCGQFAGEKQWLKAGRKLIDVNDEIVPAAEYDYMGKKCRLYSFEQTENN